MSKTHEEIQKEKLGISIEEKENHEWFLRQCRLYDTKWVSGFPQHVQDEHWARRAETKKRKDASHVDFVNYLATIQECEDDGEERAWRTFNRYHDR